MLTRRKQSHVFVRESRFVFQPASYINALILDDVQGYYI